MVVIIGPTLFGSLFQSNADIVWARIEKPSQFRLEELLNIAKQLNITINELLEIVFRQIDYNKQEIQKGNPIAKQKFKGIE